jgi:hypothetical protein
MPIKHQLFDAFGGDRPLEGDLLPTHHPTDALLRSVPYAIVGGIAIYVAFFGIASTRFVAMGLLIAFLLHGLIRRHFEDRDAFPRRGCVVYPPAHDLRTSVPYHPEMVKVYMKQGRGYWVRHYQDEGMTNSQEGIEFAEQLRRAHLEGKCDRELCYFCHHHNATDAPYV